MAKSNKEDVCDISQEYALPALLLPPTQCQALSSPSWEALAIRVTEIRHRWCTPGTRPGVSQASRRLLPARWCPLNLLLLEICCAVGRNVRCRRGLHSAWETGVGRGQPLFSSPCFGAVACDGCALPCPLVFACSVPGLVAALRLSDGVDVGEKQLPGEVFSSAVVAGRTLVVGCRDNRVYALDIIANCARCVETS